MNIAGIVKSSFIDYPGCASTVIFLGGCNFNCGYCHNREIVHCREGAVTLPDFFAFLEKRKKFIDAVCVSGGEPTLYGEELGALLSQIRSRGFRIKLDTNGSNPRVLEGLLAENLVDYVAMDVKGPWERYGAITKTPEKAKIAESVKHSLALLKAWNPRNSLERDEKSSRRWEVRTTVCRELLCCEDVRLIAGELAGCGLWYLQTFRPQEQLLDPEGSYTAYTPPEMEALRQSAEAELRKGNGGTEVRVR